MSSVTAPHAARHPGQPGGASFTTTFWIIGSCAFASMASMRICDAMLPAIASDFATSAGDAARTISAFALAYGVLQLFFGPLGDRYGKLRVVGCATIACTAGSTVAALSSSLDWLVAGRALSGAAAAGIVPLTMAWIGDSVLYEERQVVLAQFLGATVFGMICGQWLGGVAAAAMGWRAAFVVLAAVFAVAGAALLVARRGEVPPLADKQGVWRRVRGVVALPWARTVLAVVALEGALAFSALAFIPHHVHTAFGLSMPQAGALVALYGIGGLVYSRCARTLVRRVGERGLAKLGGLTLGVAFATMACAPSWSWFVPACLVAGFGFYALHNTLQTHATQMAPSARGSAMSLFACCLFLGQSLGIYAAARVIDRSSAPVVFGVSAGGLLWLGLAFATRLHARARP